MIRVGSLVFGKDRCSRCGMTTGQQLLELGLDSFVILVYRQLEVVCTKSSVHLQLTKRYASSITANSSCCTNLFQLNGFPDMVSFQSVPATYLYQDLPMSNRTFVSCFVLAAVCRSRESEC